MLQYTADNADTAVTVTCKCNKIAVKLRRPRYW